MSQQNYFTERQSEYEQETTKRVKNNIMTRRVQQLPGSRSYNVGLPISIVRLLGLKPQDLMKVRLDKQNNIVLSKVNLDNE